MVLFQDEETEALLAADFEIGHFFRERIVPKVMIIHLLCAQTNQNSEQLFETRFSAGKITRIRCNRFSFCSSLVEKLARDFQSNHQAQKCQSSDSLSTVT